MDRHHAVAWFHSSNLRNDWMTPDKHACTRSATQLAVGHIPEVRSPGRFVLSAPPQMRLPRRVRWTLND